MGAVITIDLASLPDAVRRNEQNVREAIARGARAGAERGRAIMVRATPTDQGQLRASWKVRARRGTPPAAVGEIAIAETYNDAPHAGVVELGARPHAVSPEGWRAIYEWVRRHPEMYIAAISPTAPISDLLGRARRKRKFGDRPFTGPDPQIADITNRIVHKLRVYGQRPTYFVRRNLPRVARAVSDEIGRELGWLADQVK